MHCAAIVAVPATRANRCADGLAMQPLEFPAANIGSLAVTARSTSGPASIIANRPAQL